MGQHANARALAEYERQQARKQDDYFDDEPPLTEAERAAEWDAAYWDRIDAEASGKRIGEWR